MEPMTVTYAHAPTVRGPRALAADLYLPDGAGSRDLLVWLHSGGFRSGSRQHRNHARIAAEFAAHGIASAFLDYRLARPPAVLTPAAAALAPVLAAEAAEAGADIHPTFYGPRALAATEDCCAFLALAESRRADWRLSGRYLVGGSSAGALVALNSLYLATALGLSRPAIATVLACSGAFPWPGRASAPATRVLALVATDDPRMPATSMRRLAAARAAAGDDVVLIERDDYAHGDVRLWPGEPLADAVRRTVTVHRAGGRALAAPDAGRAA